MWSAGLDFRGEVAMFEDFSERARRIIFFSRKVAGERGAAAIEVEDLVQVLVLEDQADYAKLFPESAVPGTARMALPTHRAFFTAEVAAEIQRGLEPLMLSKANPLPTSVDMPLSDAAQRVLLAAMDRAKESHDGQVEPLHLLAEVLSDDATAVADALKQAGMTQEAVEAAIESGEYS
jgi:ATP-dependent Clp protease ATP-binding subunit ClpA